MTSCAKTGQSEGLDKQAKIYVAGHTGLVGSAVMRALIRQGFTNLVARSHAELDLTDQAAVTSFMAQEKPEHVIICAAKVGGIWANNTHPAEFIFINLAIAQNLIRQSRSNGVDRLVFLGSSCVYPRDCPQPMKEEYLLTGPLEFTNRSYALAKIAGIEMCWACNRQFGTRYMSLMPTNVYGPGDNYDLKSSHVLPALIRKVHEAKENRSPAVAVWGTGRPRREFIHSDDLADACVYILNLPEKTFADLAAHEKGPWLNVGFGQDISIKDLVGLVAEVVGFEGEIFWDTEKPDGTPLKLLDCGPYSGPGLAARASPCARA